MELDGPLEYSSIHGEVSPVSLLCGPSDGEATQAATPVAHKGCDASDDPDSDDDLSWKPFASTSTHLGTLMPNSIQVAELQHICDNANKETHQSMKHWDSFYDQLKDFENFLALPDRRRRFIWTCLRGTRFARYEGIVSGWSAHLYEKGGKKLSGLRKICFAFFGFSHVALMLSNMYTVSIAPVKCSRALENTAKHRGPSPQVI